MKKMIRISKRGVLAITMSLLVVAMYAPDASAQGRGSSKSGTKQRVEKRSEKKQSSGTSAKKSERASSKATTRRSGDSSGRSKATTRKKSGSASSGSAQSRQSTGRSRSSSSQKATDRTRAPKPTQEVGRKSDTKSGSGRSGRGSVRGSDSNSSGARGSSRGARSGGDDSQSGKTGVRGSSDSRSGRGSVRGSDSNSSGARGSSRGVRTGGDDSRSGKSGVRGSSGSRSGSGNVGRSGDSRGNRGNRGVRNGNRGVYNGPVFSERKKVKTYRHRNNHKWQHQYFRPDRVSVHIYPHNWHRHIHVSSHVHVGVTWPWQKRYRRHWQPRYRYRQVVYVNVGWGRNQRQSRIDVRTYYKQRVRHANSDYAEIEIDIDAIELYENGRFIGYVDKIPSKLREINATVYSNGRVEFDRNVFLIGDIYRGFEMISTRYYDDYLLNSYDRKHGVRVGRVDLRKERVKSVRRSRLFNSHNFNGNVPVSLLPEDDRLFDYSYELFSGYDDYGQGRYNSDFLGQNGFRADAYDTLSEYETGLDRIDEVSYSTSRGAIVEMKRESALERIE